MNVFDLAEGMGLCPKRTASTNGGEYHSACPDAACGGKDRFCVWPKQGETGRYWCRQCNKQGDAIQFCRDFMGLSFKDACQKVGREFKLTSRKSLPPRHGFKPTVSEGPSNQWQVRALDFVKQCHQVLLKSLEAQTLLKQRGLAMETAERFQIGYNPEDIWEMRSQWGLSEEKKEDGKPKKQWLPAGLVVPTFSNKDSAPNKLKVRRSYWKEGDPFPKYIEISGSQKQYAVYGDLSLPIVVVEAELDAIVLQQEAGEECCSIALGGAGKHPDVEVHRILCSASCILFSLDFDVAGKKEYAFWKKTYPQVVAWPAPLGKSPSEAFLQGVNLRSWVASGSMRVNVGL